MDNVAGKTKKRGRPRKNVECNIIPQKKENEDENIVLFIALSDDDSQDENNFTINDTDTQCQYKCYDNISSDESTNIEPINNTNKNSTNKNNSKMNHKIHINYYCTIVADNYSNDVFIPKETSVKCWWCDEQFNTIPVYIPNGYKNETFYVFGNFCSFNCAAKYNSVILPDYKRCTRHALLENMKNKITGDETPIKFAQPRETLCSKGGPLSIHDFRKDFINIDTKCVISLPPMIPLIHVIEQYT